MQILRVGALGALIAGLGACGPSGTSSEEAAGGSSQITCDPLPDAPSEGPIEFTLRNDTSNTIYLALSGAVLITPEGVELPVSARSDCLPSCSEPTAARDCAPGVGGANLISIEPGGEYHWLWSGFAVMERDIADLCPDSNTDGLCVVRSSPPDDWDFKFSFGTESVCEEPSDGTCECDPDADGSCIALGAISETTAEVLLAVTAVDDGGTTASLK